jgi:RNA polymerase sigma-70 factor, ECF subfamily
MAAAQLQDLTQLLDRVGTGDRMAAEQLFPMVYQELRALAGSFFKQQHAGHTLQPTALVHDVYLRMVDIPGGPKREPKWKDRSHFFAIAAKAMRQILADHARRNNAQKRGGQWREVTLDQAVTVVKERPLDVIALDEALSRLQKLDERKSQVVELRFFGGLTNQEVAEVLGVSRATVADDWTVARAWLRGELYKGESVESDSARREDEPE